MAPERQWTAAQLADEAAVSKEALVGFLQAHTAAAVRALLRARR